MRTTRTTYCGSCATLRWIEDWRETHQDMLSIVLGPCGHVIERTARLEWSTQQEPARRHAAHRDIARKEGVRHES